MPAKIPDWATEEAVPDWAVDESDAPDWAQDAPGPTENLFPPTEPLRLGTNLHGPSTTAGGPPLQINGPMDTGIGDVVGEIPSNLAFAVKHPRQTAHAAFGAVAIPGTIAYNAAADTISKMDPRGEQYSGNLEQTIPQLVARFGGEPYRSPAQQFVAEAAPYSRKTAIAANLGIVAPEMASQMFLNPAGIAGRLLALGFSADMVASSGPMFEEYAKEYYKPDDQQDKGKMAELEAGIIQTVGFAPLAAKHGAKDIAITRGDKGRLAVRKIAKQLNTAEPTIPTVLPEPVRQLGVRVATEPFMQPGIKGLVDAAVREAMSPLVNRGDAMQALRGAVEPPSIESVTRRPVQAEGGKLPPGEAFPRPVTPEPVPLRSMDEIMAQRQQPTFDDRVGTPLKTKEEAAAARKAAAVKPKPEPPPEPPVEPQQPVQPKPPVKPGPTIDYARRVSEMTPDEFESVPRPFNDLNIELGLRSTASDVAALKQMRDKASADWMKAMEDAKPFFDALNKARKTATPEELAALQKAAEVAGRPMGILGSKPQFFNEAIELAEMIRDNDVRFDNRRGDLLQFTDNVTGGSFTVNAKVKAQGIIEELARVRETFAKEPPRALTYEDGQKMGLTKTQVEEINAESAPQPKAPAAKPVEAGKSSDPILNAIDKAIEITSPEKGGPKGKLFEGVTSLPAWLTEKAVNEAFKVLRKVYLNTKDMAAAMKAAVDSLRGLKGFDEADALRVLTEPTKPTPTAAASPAPSAPAKPAASEVPMVEGDKTKMRLSAERAQTSEIVPEPVQERIRTAPESLYKRQPEAMVEEVVSQMSDAELAAAPKESNIYVASRLELMRQLFNEGKFDEGYQLFKEVSKTGTEFGQNINQFKRLKGSTPFHVVKLVNEGLKESGRDPLSKKQAEELAKISDESINAGKAVKEAKDRWEENPTEELARAADAALARADKLDLELQRRMNRYQVKTWPQMLKTFAQGNPLTLGSHVANTTGNIVGALMENGSRTSAAFIDGIYSLLTRTPRTVAVQPVRGTLAAGGGFVSGLKKAPGVLAKGSGESIKGEHRANLRPMVALRDAFAKNPDIPTVGGKVPFSERARLAVEGTFGITPEVMLRMLSAADKAPLELARARLIQEQVKLNKLSPERARMAQNFPELVFDKKTMDIINNEAADAIYQRPSKSIQAMNSLIREKGGDWGDLAFTLAIAPYRLTPWNLVRRTIQYNPIYGIAATAANAAKGNRRAAMLSSGRTVVGLMLYGAGYWLYKNGLVGPSLDEQGDSPKERLLAGEILPPGHVNLSGLDRAIREKASAKASGREADMSVANFRPGDETMDLKRIGGAAGAIIQSSTDIMRDFEKNPDKSGSELVGTLLENSTLNQASFTINQSFLQGVTGLLEAIQRRDATRYIAGVESMLLNVATPNTLTGLSRATRPYAVDVKDNEFKGVIQNRFGILGADDYLSVKRDLWGEPLKQTPEGRNALLYHLFDISKSKQVTDDPVAGELYRLWRKTADKSVIPSLPERSVTENRKTYPLNNEQYSRYAELVGKERRWRVENLMKNPLWGGAPEANQIKLLGLAYQAGMDAAKVQISEEFGSELEAKEAKAGFQFPESP